jgi:hypothetical protein
MIVVGRVAVASDVPEMYCSVAEMDKSNKAIGGKRAVKTIAGPKVRNKRAFVIEARDRSSHDVVYERIALEWRQKGRSRIQGYVRLP